GDRGGGWEREGKGNEVGVEREMWGGSHGSGKKVVGNRLCLKHGQIMLRPHSGDRSVGFEPIGKNHLYPLGAEHNVKIGEDSTFVDDDDPGANALLGVLTSGFVPRQTTDANNRRPNNFVSLSRGRR